MDIIALILLSLLFWLDLKTMNYKEDDMYLKSKK